MFWMSCFVTIENWWFPDASDRLRSSSRALATLDDCYLSLYVVHVKRLILDGVVVEKNSRTFLVILKIVILKILECRVHHG